MKKVLILALFLSLNVRSEIDEKLTQSSMHVVEELTGLIFSFRPNINQLESLINTILDFVNHIGENKNQTVESKNDLDDLQQKLRNCLYKIRSFDAIKRNLKNVEDSTEKKDADINKEEVDPNKALHEHEKKLMVAGFKEILSALFGMMLQPSGMAIYTEKLVSGVLKILSSILADGKIDKHDIDNMQSAIKDVIFLK
jgi:DNA repair exonuclease SbcCD ATPase subunit